MEWVIDIQGETKFQEGIRSSDHFTAIADFDELMAKVMSRRLQRKSNGSEPTYSASGDEPQYG